MQKTSSHSLSRSEAIGSSTRLMGVIGRNIAYSLSPRIHNYAIDTLGVDAVYLNFDFSDAASLPGFLASAWDAGATGFNVTQPYKQAVAQILGLEGRSINTLSRGEGAWLASSTDGPGFLAALMREFPSYRNFESIVLLGNGGAAYAVAEALGRFHRDLVMHWKEIIVIRRNAQADSAFAQLMPAGLTMRCLDWQDRTALEKFAQGLRGSQSLIIQASSADRTACEHALAPFSAGSPSVFDLCYRPDRRFAYDWAQPQGLKCCDGLSMLIEQAIRSQELWWGKTASYAELEAHLKAEAL